MKHVREHAGLILALLITLMVVIPYYHAPLGRDQSNWVTIAMAIEDGRVVYRDVAFVNTPGLGYALALVNTITGNPVHGPWWVHLISLLAIAISGYLYILKTHNPTVAGFSVVLLALLWPVTMDWGDISQKDQHAFAFALMACTAMAYARERKGLDVLAGVFLGLSVFMKTTGVLYVVMAAVILMRNPERKLRLMRVGLGIAIAALPWVAYFTWTDAWGWMWASLVERGSAYGAFGRLSLSELAIRITQVTWGVLGFTMLGLVLALRRKAHLPLASLILTTLAIVLLQGKGNVYHIVPLSAVTLLSVGVVLGEIITQEDTIWKGAVLAIIAASAVLVWNGQHHDFHRSFIIWGELSQDEYDMRFDGAGMASTVESKRLGAWIADRTSPDDLIFVWGMESQIYPYSGRLFVGPSFCDAPIWHPQLAEIRPDYYHAQLDRFIHALDETPPELFIVATQDANPLEPWDSDRSLRSIPELVEWLKAHYTLEHKTHTFLVYRRAHE